MKKKNPITQDKFLGGKVTLGGGFVGSQKYLEVSVHDGDYSLTQEWNFGFRICRTIKEQK